MEWFTEFAGYKINNPKSKLTVWTVKLANVIYIHLLTGSDVAVWNDSFAFEEQIFTQTIFLNTAISSCRKSGFHYSDITYVFTSNIFSEVILKNIYWFWYLPPPEKKMLHYRQLYLLQTVLDISHSNETDASKMTFMFILFEDQI